MSKIKVNHALVEAANEARKLQEPITTRGHTPGPWKYEKPFGVNIPVREGEAGGQIIRTWLQAHEGEAEANARLIAAAPDLLAALESLFENCSMIHSQWGEGGNAREADQAITNAKAAIAKARGES